MKLEHKETSNKGNGTAWRDIVRIDGEFSPAYVGEACNEDAARLFCAAPEMLECLKFCDKWFERFAPVADTVNGKKAILPMLECVKQSIAKAEGRVVCNVKE